MKMFSEIFTKQDLINYGIAILIASVGGITRFLMDENHSIWRLIIAIITAGFSGWLTFMICREYEISNNITAIICGISGLTGETTLRIIQKFFVKKVSDYTRTAPPRLKQSKEKTKDHE